MTGHHRQRTCMVAAAAVGLALSLLAGCASGVVPERVVAVEETPSVTPAPATTSTISPLPPMTPRQMAGQRVIFGFNGYTPPRELLARIRRGEAAGVIFFKHNIKSRRHLRAVTRQLQKANADPRNPVRAPLLLMIDQEGGQVRRMSGEPRLSQKDIAAAADPLRAARLAGKGAALNLKDVGLNVDLAPVLDVYRHRGDFSDRFERSYSKDPSVVATLGAAFIRSMQKRGVAAAPKHFPGLGAAPTEHNTDEGPVTLKVSARRLRAVDELPFRAAVEADTKLVMLAWAVYPSLDPTTPAGLSTTIVQGELRERLGFRGVTITDSLGAGGLKGFGSMRRRARLAANAGMDLLLTTPSRHGMANGAKAADGLERGYTNGSLEEQQFEEALRRVIALRQSLAD